jgi:flagellar biosynthesis protein FliQ
MQNFIISKKKTQAGIYTMSGKQYLKNQLPVLLLNLLGVLALALFLIATGTSRQAISFIALVWIVVVVCYLTVSFFIQKRHCETLLVMAEQLGEKYLMPEVMAMPERADEQVFYQILKLAEKSMLENISAVMQERRDYRDYIEQWVHEVKTPITAMKLLCENHPSEFSRAILTELEKVFSLHAPTVQYNLYSPCVPA